MLFRLAVWPCDTVRSLFPFVFFVDELVRNRKRSKSCLRPLSLIDVLLTFSAFEGGEDE